MQINTRESSESRIAWFALSVAIACTLRLTLKRSPMTWLDDVMYFHRVVWMWFIMWTVPKQIPVTSAAYAMCLEANPGCRAQRGVLDSSADPDGDWTRSPLL